MPSPNLNGRHRILTPVKRNSADSFLLLMISAFGVTVILTRFFLELTGYPQIGDRTFHIAHVLWGGMLLFIATALVLILANHWALWVSALLGGIGTGLFIDEIGKFITQNNDYFFPLAFPIIYAFMIACVWLYFRVRRSDRRDTRTLLYHILEDLKEVLDNDLDLSEHSELIEGMKQVAETAEDVSERKFVVAIREFVDTRERKEQVAPSWLERTVAKLKAFLALTLPRSVLKTILIIGFGLLGITSFAKLFGLYTIAKNSGTGLTAFSSFVVVNGKSEYIVNHPYLFAVNSFFMTAVALLAVVSTIMLLIGRERIGLRVGTLGLVLALTIVNLLTFYFSQLYALADTLWQLALIGIAQWYRLRFFLNPPDPA